MKAAELLAEAAEGAEGAGAAEAAEPAEAGCSAEGLELLCLPARGLGGGGVMQWKSLAWLRLRVASTGRAALPALMLRQVMSTLSTGHRA